MFDKPDHFIGSCYRQYRQANAARKGGVTATTEYEARDDAADAIQLALMSEDEPAKRLWRTVRTMALAGQQATLRQLGVAFECCDYESAEDSYVKALIERGLDDGLFDRTPAGEVVYWPAAGRKLRLRNAAGLPEESARLVSLIRRLLTGWAGNAIHVIVAGTEWRASMRVYPELMHRLGITHVHDSYAQAFYGMIMRDGRKMSSSDGSGVLVDHFLRTVASPPPLAATVLKSFLLAVRRADPIAFDARALRDRGNNPGWELAEAWQTLTPQERGGPAPRPSADAQQLMADALSRISFDHAIHRARALARAVIADAATPRQRADFRVLVDALSLRPEPSSFAFDRAVPLATMPAPSWAAA